MTKVTADAEKLLQFYHLLAELYGPVECALRYQQPYELLIAAMLSAQCTDKRVNIITAELFQKYRSIADFANCPLTELEHDIRTAGLFRTKAKNIIATCRKLQDEHNGQLPRSMAELTALPGVGRKTANVVLGNALGIPGFPVDTHVKRVLNRLGAVKSDYPEKIEQAVNAVVPSSLWTDFSHLIIIHGRECCQARRPACQRCPANKICSYQKNSQS